MGICKKHEEENFLFDFGDFKDYPDCVMCNLDKLSALEAGGVDNWDGYDFALAEFERGSQE